MNTLPNLFYAYSFYKASLFVVIKLLLNKISNIIQYLCKGVLLYHRIFKGYWFWNQEYNCSLTTKLKFQKMELDFSQQTWNIHRDDFWIYRIPHSHEFRRCWFSISADHKFHMALYLHFQDILSNNNSASHQIWLLLFKMVCQMGKQHRITYGSINSYTCSFNIYI